MLEEAERIRELDPGFVDLDIGNPYLALGWFEEFARSRAAFHEQCGAPCDWSREAGERGWAEGGVEGWARALLKATKEREESSPWIVAMLSTALGETDEAFVWLERGDRERDPSMLFIEAHPAFAPPASMTCSAASGSRRSDGRPERKLAAI